ncbi:MAG: cytochrome c oxidase assembly protein [Actinobacteria bacterium]|nr:cytochrome c oxidase assembly protein [Actinomycetota bacterium]
MSLRRPARADDTAANPAAVAAVTGGTVSRMVVTAWTITTVVLAVLVVAVVRFLVDGSGDEGDSMGMSHAAHAVYRGGGAIGTHSLLGARLVTAWQLDAVALAVLVLAAATYLTAVAAVPLRHPGQRWPLIRTASYLAGLAVCGYATCGSFAVYDEVLFSAHMLGHLCLVMLAPALIMCGRPATLALAAASDRRARRWRAILQGRVISVLTAPPVALACYTAVIVGSHLTGLMNTIMQATWAGQLEHLVYLVVGCQFFCLVVGNEPIRWRLGSPARWLLLAIAMAVDTFTGVVLLQTTSPVAMTTAPGLSVDPLSDTHTGGAIMWLGGDAVMAVVMIALVLAWLRRPEGRTDEREGWAEQARRATFAAQTGSATPAAAEFDDSDAARTAYNEWLARLNR